MFQGSHISALARVTKDWALASSHISTLACSHIIGSGQSNNWALGSCLLVVRWTLLYAVCHVATTLILLVAASLSERLE